MTSIAQEAKTIIQCLEGVFHAFESAIIGSGDYRDKAMLVHQNISALARLHPNWSEERKVILDKHRHDAPPLDETSPFVLIHEYSEVMFRAWHQMRVPQPSIRTLARSGDTFRESLTCLKDECNELTNRKHHKLSMQIDTIPTTEPSSSEQTTPVAVPQNAEKEGNL